MISNEFSIYKSMHNSLVSTVDCEELRDLQKVQSVIGSNAHYCTLSFLFVDALSSRFNISNTDVYTMTAKHLKNAPARLENKKVCMLVILLAMG